MAAKISSNVYPCLLMLQVSATNFIYLFLFQFLYRLAYHVWVWVMKSIYFSILCVFFSYSLGGELEYIYILLFRPFQCFVLFLSFFVFVIFYDLNFFFSISFFNRFVYLGFIIQVINLTGQHRFLLLFF